MKWQQLVPWRVGAAPRRRCTLYQQHKEAARRLIHARLEYFNQYYGFSYHRVSIKDQRRCWGSCSALGNLNFSYKLLFLPAGLRDYIIVHELCHLGELNHSRRFWDLVAEVIPDYQLYMSALRQCEQRHGTSLRAIQTQYQSSAVGHLELVCPAPARLAQTSVQLVH